MDETVARAAFTVSLNPSNGHLIVDAGSLDTFANPWFEVMDVTGRMIYQERWTAGRQVLDLDIAAGQYIVVLRDGERRVRALPLLVR